MALPRRITLALAIAALLGGLLALAGPAAAAEPPSCWNTEVWARPGLTREYQLYCPRTERVEVVAEPHGTRFEGLVNGASLKFRLTPDADAPEHDTFTLRLTGPGGSSDEDVRVTNVPLSQNTAPRCEPASTGQRTDGLTAVALEFHVLCWDDEHDDYTLYGNGPGTHLDAPLHNDGGMGGQSVPSWRYKPTIASGQEQTTYYAIDALGARSADAPISVQLGADVDRLPTCGPNGSGWFGDLMAVYSRPGTPRRFSILCQDPDGDAILPSIAAAPTRGDLTSFDRQPASRGWWGTQVWVDVTYVPRTSYEGQDPFSVVGDGIRGPGPAGQMAIVSRVLPENSGSGCGWSGASTAPGTPVTLSGSCNDGDGDRLKATVSSAPVHGHADAPVMSPGRFGDQQFSIAYRPDPGFEGIDVVGVTVDDGAGSPQEIEFDVTVRSPLAPAPPAYAIGTPFDWPELRPKPTGATWLPAAGQATPVSPLDQARRALGTRGVRLVKRIGDASVYGPRVTPTAAASQRALAVTCPVRCSLTSSSTVAGGGAGRAKLRVSPGRAAALVLKLSSAQRTRVHRAGSARAVFRLKVARSGRRARRATVRLALRG
jgi:hypothetical protein